MWRPRYLNGRSGGPIRGGQPLATARLPRDNGQECRPQRPAEILPVSLCVAIRQKQRDGQLRQPLYVQFCIAFSKYWMKFLKNDERFNKSTVESVERRADLIKFLAKGTYNLLKINKNTQSFGLFTQSFLRTDAKPSL